MALSNDVTDHWIDLYTACLGSAIEAVSDPKKMYERLKIGEHEEGRAEIGKLDMEKYRTVMKSWDRVRADLKLFGLTLNDSLMISPSPYIMQSLTWEKNAWIEISHEIEVSRPLKFLGRDALTARNFLSFYSSQCDSVDPGKCVREALERQGINAENFHKHADRLAIKNPFV